MLGHEAGNGIRPLGPTIGAALNMSWGRKPRASLGGKGSDRGCKFAQCRGDRKYFSAPRFRHPSASSDRDRNSD